jgi:hypothetical protein
MATTYVPIDTQTVVNTSTNTITFTSIPSTYTDLIFVCNYGESTNAGIKVIVNNDSTSGLYSMTRVRGDGSTASSSRRTSQNQWYIPEGPSLPTDVSAITTLNFMNYSNTAIFKTVLQRDNVASSGLSACVNLWASTVAINRIDVICLSSDVFANGSTFSLYGVASAAIAGPKATGGDIVTTDGTYWYHGFRASGTFTPSVALTADMLVVAGGGGGGNTTADFYSAAGAGAGGVLNLSSQSLTATGYTVTVGGGGAGGTGSNGTNGVNSQFGSLTAAVGGGAGSGASGGTGPSGGSGGGSVQLGAVGTGTFGQGNNGGQGNQGGGGGGGAGAVGGSGSTPQGLGRPGGAGTNTYATWLNTTGTGVSGFIGGGGGGGYTTYYLSSGDIVANGGSGGGGTGGGDSSGAKARAVGTGTINTGGGGGGAGGYSSPGFSGSGAGGSGLVIVRYAV